MSLRGNKLAQDVKTSRRALSGARLWVAFVAVITASMFSGPASAKGEKMFWDWFTRNEARLFALGQDQDRVFDELTEQLNLVNPDLTFEFGPVAGEKREFVISAGGIKAAFPAVEALYEAAPALPRWTWVKFRPRRAQISDLNYDGKTVRADDVHYMLAKDGDKVGIVLFFDGYSEQDRATFGQIGYLFLDEALGEYTVETRVGFIEFKDRQSPYFSRASPLRELASHFDEVEARAK